LGTGWGLGGSEGDVGWRRWQVVFDVMPADPAQLVRRALHVMLPLSSPVCQPADHRPTTIRPCSCGLTGTGRAGVVTGALLGPASVTPALAQLHSGCFTTEKSRLLRLRTVRSQVRGGAAATAGRRRGRGRSHQLRAGVAAAVQRAHRDAGARAALRAAEPAARMVRATLQRGHITGEGGRREDDGRRGMA
jgi:hypothetical protein